MSVTQSGAGDDVLGIADMALSGNGNVQAAQLYDPYGTVRYSSGTMPGSYGFAGQHADATTGLDYFNARYYDPLASQFISADTTLPGKGYDVWGLSRYAYVAGNPEGRTDPTGHDWLSSLVHTVSNVVHTVAPAATAVLDATTGIPSMIHDVHTIFFDPKASAMQKILAGGDLLLNVAMDASMVVGVGEGLRAAYVGVHIAEHVAEDVGEHALAHAGEDAVAHAAEHEGEDLATHAGEGAGSCAFSFAPATLVAIPGGETPIAALKTGDHVLAYDPATGKASTQTVTATSIHRDDNLVDITLRVSGPAANAATSASATAHTSKASAHAAPATGTAATSSVSTHDEIVHTTTTHPWLTADHGWLPASFLHMGEPVVQLDGTTGTVEAIHAVPGAAAMWDLTVSNVHTFAVGAGQFVVHNCLNGGDAPCTPDGKYAPRNGEPGRDGAGDEVTAWEHLELDGANVRRGQTKVSAPGFKDRFYDGTVEIDGDWYGIETKGGTAKRSIDQRAFGNWLNTPGNSVQTMDGRTLVGVFDVWIDR